MKTETEKQTMYNQKPIALTFPKSTELADMSITLAQEADCCGPSDLPHSIEITTPDGGGGKFLVIKTERWAFGTAEEIDSFCDFLTRMLQDLEEPKTP